MSIKAEIVADSVNEFNDRITTMLVTMPRIILAEFNTHRMFSRNSASSRAIPFNKMVKIVEENPFIPIAWQKDHKGMQGVEYITDEEDIKLNTDAWLKARDNAVSSAKYLNHGAKEGRDNGVTKQLCNRLLEPFMWTTVIVTATEFENFFALRCSKYQTEAGIFRSKKDAIRNTPFIDSGKETQSSLYWLKLNKGQAEIHMMVLAEAMWDAYNQSTPKKLQAGEWHIPFGDNILIQASGNFAREDHYYALKSCKNEEELKVKVATVMAARTSYTVVGEDQKPLSYARMIEIHDSMFAADPKHMSPFEHCAKAMTHKEYYHNLRGEFEISSEYHEYSGQEGGYSIPIIEGDGKGWCANYRGWIQYRKMIPNENITL